MNKMVKHIIEITEQKTVLKKERSKIISKNKN